MFGKFNVKQLSLDIEFALGIRFLPTLRAYWGYDQSGWYVSHVKPESGFVYETLVHAGASGFKIKLTRELARLTGITPNAELYEKDGTLKLKIDGEPLLPLTGWAGSNLHYYYAIIPYMVARFLDIKKGDYLYWIYNNNGWYVTTETQPECNGCFNPLCMKRRVVLMNSLRVTVPVIVARAMEMGLNSRLAWRIAGPRLVEVVNKR